MKVFLDTNVFYNNWFASNPNFKMLFRYLNNEGEELLLSDLVVQEVENIRNRELSESLSEIKRHVKSIQKLTPSKVSFDESTLNISEYKLIDYVEHRVESLSGVGYGSISHEELVYRALNSVKPFSGQEKGYRDSLIWLSFLDYLDKQNIDGDVAFITNNKHDFFSYEKKSWVLHPELKKDLIDKSIGANVIPFLNIYDFVNSQVNKDEHLVDRYKLTNEFDDYLMEQTLEHLIALDNDGLSEVFSNKLFKDKLTPVIDIQGDNWDIVDDTEIINISKISDTEAYVSCQYICSGVNLDITIDLNEYHQYKSDIDSIRECYEVRTDPNTQTAVIALAFKAYTQATLVYDTVKEEPIELHVEGICP
ncbi:DUF4935 domain-containing protein [Vibrio parahaemolyticus]|nr:DUF4935 domain-containing protein [Vibrio parahaemolyticus]